MRGRNFRAIQVKTTRGPDMPRVNTALEREWHVLAVVRLAGEGSTYRLDQSQIFMMSREEVAQGRSCDRGCELSQEVVDLLWRD